MSSRRFLLGLLLFLAPARAQTPIPIAAPTPASPTALATFVIDLDSSRVLEEKNGHQKMFPASTTKIMTCLVALEHGHLNQVIRAGKNAATTPESGIYLLEGEKHSLAELIRAALVHSANDACVDIAEGLGGSQTQFVQWMNLKAKQLGCRDTHFANPHGLHDPNHFTSAHDLAVIGRAALQNPFINAVVKEKTATIGGNWKIGPTRVMTNRNKLLWRWPQCDGLKTGYTKQAGNCLVASATQIELKTGHRWRLLAVAMKSVPGKSWGDCQLLLQRAFAGYGRETVARAGDILAQGSVKGGAQPLEAAPRRDVVLPLRAGELQTLTQRVHLFDLVAPVEKGHLAGHLELFSSVSGRLQRIADVPLVAREAVSQTILARAIPPVGNRLPSTAGVARYLSAPLIGLFAALGAMLFVLIKRKNHVRRRPHSAFHSADLGARKPTKNDSRNPSRTDSRRGELRHGEPRHPSEPPRTRPKNQSRTR